MNIEELLLDHGYEADDEILTAMVRLVAERCAWICEDKGYWDGAHLAAAIRQEFGL